jgi:phage shock protein A
MLKTVAQHNATLLKEKRALEEKLKSTKDTQQTNPRLSDSNLNESRMKDIHVQIDKLISNNKMLESQIEELQSKINELQSTNAQLIANSKTFDNTIAQLESKNDTMTNAVEEISTKRMEEALRTRATEERLIRANKQIAQLTQKLETFAVREGELQVMYEDTRMKLRCYEKIVQSGKLIG